MRFGTREIIFLLVLLAMPLAAYLVVFQPRSEQIAQAREEIRQKQAKLTQLESATRSFADLGQEIDKLSQAVALLEENLPAAREEQVVLKEVWELAARQKLTPKSIRTEKPVITAQYAELPIRIVIVGDFDGLYTFLGELSELRRITRMPQMLVKKVPSDEEGQVQADLVLSIYFEAPSEGGAAPAGAVGGGRL